MGLVVRHELDFGQGDIGQNLQITRVGESFLISVGVNYDATRGTYGAAIADRAAVPAQEPARRASTAPRSRLREPSGWNRRRARSTSMPDTPRSCQPPLD